ncbi:flavin monoamine oxidase family protein [Streptomyces diastatochromogenes]|uniref:flavin monoamine oxidase family protein n=1 Tax=Streptomyces diastatochromogenes TaxID=42236 RepID=UPI0036AACD91
MVRTPLAQSLQDLAATLSARRGLTRRGLLRDAGVLGLAATSVKSLGWLASPANAATAPRIVVVGAGLAGLTTAYRLKQAGHTAQVHEASDRVGGRCWTLRGAFAGGQLAEHGGELIDQGHTAIRHLAQELGLRLDNLLVAEQNGTESLGFFDGAPYTFAQAAADLRRVWRKLHSDVVAAGYPTLYTSSTPRGRQLDQMSIVDWINESVPGGIGSKLGQLLDVAYTIEYGGDSTRQSALNLLYLLGYHGQGQLHIFGASNEKYHVAGGNDQIPERLAASLPGQITLGSELVAIKLNTHGTYTLSFQQGTNVKDVVADKVVLTLPFSILRSSVDFTQARFKALKRTAITELGMGTNSKLHLQFRTRHWEGLGSNGETFADTGYQSTWDVSRAQPGASGILVDYTGGTIGASFGTGTPQTRARQFLRQIEPVLPGISAQWNGRATIDFWLGHRWTKGSYAFWKVGQYTRFAGVEREREGNCHFAGEHTSIDFQGYLNGAVETGERAAGEILADVRQGLRKPIA